MKPSTSHLTLERSRSSKDPIQDLFAQLAEMRGKLDTLFNYDHSIPDWILIGTAGAPAFQNGWTYLDTGRRPAFWRDSAGIVHLWGFLGLGTGSLGTTAFTLPVGFRPGPDWDGGNNNNHFAVNAGGAFGDVFIQGISGVVVPDVGSAWWSLCGISFRAMG